MAINAQEISIERAKIANRFMLSSILEIKSVLNLLAELISVLTILETCCRKRSHARFTASGLWRSLKGRNPVVISFSINGGGK
jgi:hypothetical protein